ncbi:hypothetical protein PEP31012_03999 [Pandoraea eparura]|uniref:Uncharacterized protein n=1 Tax=Pandoraea eparura TaxID=2508291 RepID=A0A5E4XMN3_9BURK|nr:DUF190 domain-containing protein [Pandoraea eparura]VVE37322.1 hypothetical protein PEP31012_03999 [Pandoraea eparura]
MAKGSQLTVYFTKDQKKGGQGADTWIASLIEQTGIHGQTTVQASTGVGADGRLHAARFFELADEPVAITVVAEDEKVDALIAALSAGGVKLFYTRIPIEYGYLGGD